MGGAAKIVSKAVGSITGANEAAKAMKRQAEQQAEIAAQQEEVRKRQSEVQAQRERLKSQREARIRRADIISSSGAGGVGLSGTSGVVGGISSVASQEGSNQSAVNTAQQFAGELSALNTQYSQSVLEGAKAQANYFQQSSGINTIFQIASMASSMSKGGNIFGASNAPGHTGGSSYVPKLDFTQ